jgi:hypothetical protein
MTGARPGKKLEEWARIPRDETTIATRSLEGLVRLFPLSHCCPTQAQAPLFALAFAS